MLDVVAYDVVPFRKVARVRVLGMQQVILVDLNPVVDLCVMSMAELEVRVSEYMIARPRVDLKPWT